MFKVLPIEAPAPDPKARRSEGCSSESPSLESRSSESLPFEGPPSSSSMSGALPVMPQDLLSRLTARGLRVLDSRRWLLVAAPPEVFLEPGWEETEALLRRWAAPLQQQATMVAWARGDITPGELVERILDLPSPCLPVVVETLGGVEGLERLIRAPRTVADLDVCYAAYLAGLTHQVVQGLGREEDEQEDQREEAGGPGHGGAEAGEVGGAAGTDRGEREDAGEGEAVRGAQLPQGIRDLLRTLAVDPALPAEPEGAGSPAREESPGRRRKGRRMPLRSLPVVSP